MGISIPATALVLSGGYSRRMGKAKEGLEFGEATLVEHVVGLARGLFSEAFVVAREPERLPAVGIRTLRDAEPGSGPLAGILAGLEAMENDYAFVFACDMPFLKGEVISLLWNERGSADVIIPRWKEGLEPLHAFYSKGCVEPIRRALSEGERRVISFFGDVRVREVGPEELSAVEDWESSFMNLNTPEEYQQALGLLKRFPGRDFRKG